MTAHSKRYSRQTILQEIGIDGQQKLSEAKVLVIGAGGLGCPVLQNLAGAGVGYIGIVDGDTVEETNLHRQFLYTSQDIEKNKATVATTIISNQNPEVKLTTYPTFFTTENAFEIVSDYQIIVDCTDDIMTRYLINDVAIAKGIPMVYAAIHKFEGQLSVFNYKSGPSYRCLYPENKSLKTIPNCDTNGVLGILPNALGVLQATEVLKIILGIGSILNGKLLLYDGLQHQINTISLKKNSPQIAIGIQNGNAVLNSDVNPKLRILNQADFLKEVGNNDNLIIDIRENYEEPKLTFKNIKFVSLSDLDNFLKSTDTNQKIILFCQSGNRSKMAANYLINKGFKNLYHLENGIGLLEKVN